MTTSHPDDTRSMRDRMLAGDPYIAGSGGRSASFLNFEQITFGDDGSFEILASPEPPASDEPARTWLENPADSTRILVRQVFSDWEHELPGEVHIDRLVNGVPENDERIFCLFRTNGYTPRMPPMGRPFTASVTDTIRAVTAQNPPYSLRAAMAGRGTNGSLTAWLRSF